MTSAREQNDCSAALPLPGITSYLNQQAFFHYISVETRLPVNEHLHYRGQVTRQNMYISISRVLTFSKVLFFIYPGINSSEHRGNNLYSHRRRPGSAARPACGPSALALGVLQDRTALMQLSTGVLHLTT